MPGLAATLNAPGSIDVLAAALAPRGPDVVVCRLDGSHGARLDLAVRAVIPSIPRVVGPDHRPAAERTGGDGGAGGKPGDNGKPGEGNGGSVRTVAALAIDGVASVTTLDGGYAAHGPVGLLAGVDPYAVILADVETGSLVLARHNEGPNLYYARRYDSWLVASEPAALLAAGVPGDPDPAVIARFVATGACDDTTETFYASIWRVRSGTAVALDESGGVVIHETSAARAKPAAVDPPLALADAVSDGRVGILLGPGTRGAALLATALAASDRSRPLPVHTVVFPELSGPASRPPAVLAPLPLGVVRHTQHTMDAGALDFDDFLRDLGEPVTDLNLYLLWEVARRLGGDVDTLVDDASGHPACLARVRDRIMSRYGVSVRSPLRHPAPGSTVAPDDQEAALQAVATSALPDSVVRCAVRDPAGPIGAADVLLAQRDAVAAALATPRGWVDPAMSVRALRRLYRGDPVDAEALFRAYLVERWLRTIVDTVDPVPAGPRPTESIPESSSAKASMAAPMSGAVVDGLMWSRVPVRTPAFAPGDDSAVVAAQVARWLGPECAAGPDGFGHGQWVVIFAGKALAVAQGRVRPLWEVSPGVAARVLSWVAQWRLPWLAQAWTMQVAIDEGGLPRMAAGTLAAMLGRFAWVDGLLSDTVAAIYAPRPDAVPPADGAVIVGSADADRAAGRILAGLRTQLPAELYATLAGCAVVSADGQGCRVLGCAPTGGSAPALRDLAAHLCADNPAGQGRGRTPIVLAFASSVTASSVTASAAPARDAREYEPVPS